MLYDGAGEPVQDGMIEIWQANAAGRYAHPADDRAELALEDGFLGFGRSGTVDGGHFEFVTVKPGRVPWPGGGAAGAPPRGGRLRPRAAQARRHPPLLSRTRRRPTPRIPVLAGLDDAARATLVAVAEDDGLRFDIRLQGPGHTTFFAV